MTSPQMDAGVLWSGSECLPPQQDLERLRIDLRGVEIDTKVGTENSLTPVHATGRFPLVRQTGRNERGSEMGTTFKIGEKMMFDVTFGPDALVTVVGHEDGYVSCIDSDGYSFQAHPSRLRKVYTTEVQYDESEEFAS